MEISLLPHRPRAPRLLAEFDQVQAMLDGLRALRREQYHDLETYAPYDVPDVAEPLGLRRPALGWVAAVAGALGALASYAVQWWANVGDYPVNAGGRPAHAAPAFMLATVEGTFAATAIAAVVALLVLLRFPRPWAPEDEVDGFERSTVDRYWIGMAAFASEQDRDHAVELLQRSGATRAVKVGPAR